MSPLFDDGAGGEFNRLLKSSAIPEAAGVGACAEEDVCTDEVVLDAFGCTSLDSEIKIKSPSFNPASFSIKFEKFDDEAFDVFVKITRPSFNKLILESFEIPNRATANSVRSRREVEASARAIVSVAPLKDVMVIFISLLFDISMFGC